MTYAQLIQPALWALTGGATLALVAWAGLVWRRVGPVRARRLLKLTLVPLAIALLAVPVIGVVPAGYRGVVYEWGGGIDQHERGEGVTLLAPWFQHLTNVSVRTQKVFSAKVFAQSSDLQEITVVASVNYHVEPSEAAHLYQSVGPDYQSTVIQPALFQRMKAAVGQVRAEDFALSRERLAEKIQGQLTAQLSRYGIVVEYVNIEDAIFDPRFVLAVKNKIIAEQKAKEQRNLIAAEAAVKEQTIIKAEAEGRSILIKATAQARANEKLAASVTPPLLRWQWLVTWDGALPKTLVGGPTGLLLNVDPRG